MYSILQYVLTLLTSVLLYTLISTLYQTRKHNARAKSLGAHPAPTYPSGPLGLPYVRALRAAASSNTLSDFMESRAATMRSLLGRPCHTFMTNILGQDVLVVGDAENVKAVLATQFQEFGVGHLRQKAISGCIGHGIFTQDGKGWERSRGLLRPNFVRAQVGDLPALERHFQNLLLAISRPSSSSSSKTSDDWTPHLNIQLLFFRLTMDSATEFLLGESVDTQLEEIEAYVSESGKKQIGGGGGGGGGGKKAGVDKAAFSRAWEDASFHMASRVQLGGFYWLHNSETYKANNRVLHEFVMHYADLALAKRHAKTKEKSSEDSSSADSQKAKEKYVFLEALAEQTSDREELLAAALNILLAGRETTAMLLSWILHQLLHDAAAQQKLRETVLDTFGTYEEPRNLDFAAIKGCQYLQHVLNETLRFRSIVPTANRLAMRDTTLPVGGGPGGEEPVYVKKGTSVYVDIHVMHRRKDVWGGDADVWKPERFEGRKSGWESLPFGGGPRICLGQQFALIEAGYILIRLLQRFGEFEGREVDMRAEARVKHKIGFTAQPEPPVWIRMR